MHFEYLNEIWKDIKGYEGLYQVSNFGRVKSLNFNHTGQERILKQISIKGYMNVSFYQNGVVKKVKVHRLVAEAFIPNPHNHPFVNHKDENPANNRVENLEWCDCKYNIHYGTAIVRKSVSLQKKVLQYDKEGNFIKEWNSIKEVSEYFKCSPCNISMCCRDKYPQKTSVGYIWKYKNE